MTWTDVIALYDEQIEFKFILVSKFCCLFADQSLIYLWAIDQTQSVYRVTQSSLF